MKQFVLCSLFAGLLLFAAPKAAVAQDSTTVDKDLECLAKNIAYEAPDEPTEGKLAVATVTLNRVAAKSFPKTVCAVVYQHGKRGCQFSWTCAKRLPKLDSAVYVKALEIARKALFDGARVATIKNALYFHNVHVKPRWARDNDVRFIAQIGAHLFYVPI